MEKRKLSIAIVVLNEMSVEFVETKEFIDEKYIYKISN